MGYIVIGASAGLGRSLAEQLAAKKHDLALAASDIRDLEAIAADLRIRHKVRIEVVEVDLASPTEAYMEHLATAASRIGLLDGIMFPAGKVSDDDDEMADSELAETIYRINYYSITAIIARFLPQMKQKGGGVVIGFGSIAATRGRSANFHYAASKRALESYFESLRHKLQGSGIVAQFYVVGYLDTSLAYGKRALLPKADPGGLATTVVRRLEKDFGVMYYPRYWRWILMVLRHVPWVIFKKLKF